MCVRRCATSYPKYIAIRPAVNAPAHRRPATAVATGKAIADVTAADAIFFEAGEKYVTSA